MKERASKTLKVRGNYTCWSNTFDSIKASVPLTYLDFYWIISLPHMDSHAISHFYIYIYIYIYIYRERERERERVGIPGQTRWRNTPTKIIMVHYKHINLHCIYFLPKWNLVCRCLYEHYCTYIALMCMGVASLQRESYAQLAICVCTTCFKLSTGRYFYIWYQCLITEFW
jgi:hypothetical protein